MKRLVIFLAFFLLLASCTPDGVTTPTPTPAFPPSPTPSPAPTTPQGLVWGVNFGLEDIYLDQLPTVPGIEIGEETTYPHYDLLAQLPEEDISLYGLILDSGEGLLLRRGPILQYFDQPYTLGEGALPDLFWADFDRDGACELAVRSLEIREETHAYYHLNLYSWDGTRWTDHPFDPQIFSDNGLGEFTDLFFQIDGSDITATLGFSDDSSLSTSILFDGVVFSLGEVFHMTDHTVV